MKAAMMSALQDFSKQTENTGIKSMEMEDGTHLFRSSGSLAYLAAKVSGHPPVALARVFDDAVAKIHV